MKKYIKYAAVFLALGVVFGVFYREFSKAYGVVNTYATLGLVHTHFLVLGVAFVLIIGLVTEKIGVGNNKLYKWAFPVYCSGVLGAGLMMAVRGILDILVRSDNIEFAVSGGANGAIAGFSGIFHAVLGIGLALIFIVWMKKKPTVGEAAKSFTGDNDNK